MRTAWILAATLATLPGAFARAADGLATPTVRQPVWPQWQGRLAFGALTPDWRLDPASGLSLMGDYYFLTKALPGTTGGFRATSGLVYGARPTLWAGTSASTSTRGFGLDRQTARFDGSEPATLPYLGFGYTGLSARGGWGFSADLGVMAYNPAPAVRFGRVFTGAQTFDELVRELRIGPVLQLGASYAF